jgi:hypothetical protein
MCPKASISKHKSICVGFTRIVIEQHAYRSSIFRGTIVEYCVCVCACARAPVCVCVCVYIYIYIRSEQAYSKLTRLMLKHVTIGSCSLFQPTFTSPGLGSVFHFKAERLIEHSDWIPRSLLWSACPTDLVSLSVLRSCAAECRCEEKALCVKASQDCVMKYKNQH